MLKDLLLIGSGGFMGAVARYLVYQVSDGFYHRSGFPVGTMIVNLFGSLLIGIAFGLSVKFDIFSRHSFSHLLFVTGFLGSFTTFSTFSQDSLILLTGKNYTLFFLSVFINITAGIILAAAGYFSVTSIN
jgi:CrcB protein